MKPTTSWKQFEARVARRFGLKRRGADYGDASGGKTDAVNLDGSESQHWALECKLYGRIGYQVLLDACRQVEAAAKPGQEPIVVAKLKNLPDDNALVVMRFATFREWRLSTEVHDDPGEHLLGEVLLEDGKAISPQGRRCT